MMKRIGILFTLFTFLGCSAKGNYANTTRFHDDGRAKPIVALVPVFDRSESHPGWSLSEEFTDRLKNRLMKRKNFYVSIPSDIHTAVADLAAEHHPFVADISWVKEVFDSHEYVVFTELVEHEIRPKERAGNLPTKITPSSELAMTMRIRVFDLRGTYPAIILQEFIRQNHLIPKPINLTDPDPDHWKKITYGLSPIGLAHAQLSREAVKRIEDYILLSNSK
ncbi:MAG: CT253 family lipoprotein [Chlamydiota bacterium]